MVLCTQGVFLVNIAPSHQPWCRCNSQEISQPVMFVYLKLRNWGIERLWADVKAWSAPRGAVTATDKYFPSNNFSPAVLHIRVLAFTVLKFGVFLTCGFLTICLPGGHFPLYGTSRAPSCQVSSLVISGLWKEQRYWKTCIYAWYQAMVSSK